MARCPYLEFEYGGMFSSGSFHCKLCGKCLNDSEVNYKCKTDYGEAYEDCPIYRDR